MKISTALILLLTAHLSLSLDPESALYQEVFQYHTTTSTKADFAFEVVNKIYTAFHQWFFTITFCEFTYFENRILKYTETYGYGYAVMLLNGCPDSNRTKVRPKIDKHGQTAYLVTSNELDLDSSENSIDALQRTGVFKPRSAVIFVINDKVKEDQYLYISIKTHFQFLWSRSITNSVLILRTDRLKIFTYNPFLDVVRDVTEAKDLTHFLNQQYHNLYGAKLRLSVFRKTYVSDETGPVRCDSNLAKTVMNSLNASCEPLVPRDGSTVGDLLDNGTATGVTADLMDGYTDLELSSRILKNSYYGYIDTTYPLTQDELCFVVKNSDRQAAFTTILGLISTLLMFVFIFIVIFFIILGIVFRKMEEDLWGLKNKSPGATALELIKCMLRQTVTITFKGHVFRTLVMIAMIYSLIINCVIDGVIFSALQYPRFRPDLNTLSDLLEANLTIGVHNRDLKLFEKSLSAENYKAVKSRIELINDNKIKDIITKRKFEYAVLLRKTDANTATKKLANLHNGRSLFHIMHNCPVPCSIVYGLRYGSPYLPRVDYILRQLNQAGILQHWIEAEEYSLQRQISRKVKENKALDMCSLQEVFYVLFIGTLISFITFFLELIINITNHGYPKRNLTN